MSRIHDRTVITGFGLGWSAVRRMPERSAYELFDRIADGTWLRHTTGVRRLEFNLERALGISGEEARHMSRRSMRSYMRYYCDAFRLPGWSDERIRSTFVLHGREKLDAALAKGGAVVSLLHSGNWDHAGAWAALEYGNVTTVAERLKPEELYQKFLAIRIARNIEVLPHAGNDGPLLATLSERASQGRLIAMLGDRDLTARGIPVQYFGHPSKLPVGPAAIALDTGVPLFPGTLWFEPDGARAMIHDELPMPTQGTRAEKIAVLTQQLATVFEGGVRKNPEDWHMLARVWMDQPSSAPAQRTE